MPRVHSARLVTDRAKDANLPVEWVVTVARTPRKSRQWSALSENQDKTNQTAL